MNPIPDGLLQWLDAFAECVRSRDFERGRTLFDPRVQGFGTIVEHASGLPALEQGQWKCVWPNTRGFGFLPAPFEVILSADGSQACLLNRWESEGVRPDGSTFRRHGRCTTLLQRSPAAPGGWLAVHTHYSKSPSGDL